MDPNQFPWTKLYLKLFNVIVCNSSASLSVRVISSRDTNVLCARNSLDHITMTSHEIMASAIFDNTTACTMTYLCWQQRNINRYITGPFRGIHWWWVDSPPVTGRFSAYRANDADSVPVSLHPMCYSSPISNGWYISSATAVFLWFGSFEIPFFQTLKGVLMDR